MTVGYIIEHLLGVKLRIVPQFHSHLEPLKFIKKENLANQVSSNSENIRICKALNCQ